MRQDGIRLAKWLMCPPLIVRAPVGSYQRSSLKLYKLPPCMARNALGKEFGSAAQLSKRPGSVWNCLWGNALKRSPGIICKSRVSYPGLGFLSSATWPSLPKKHYNGLNQTKPKINILSKLYFKNITLSKL